MHKKLINLREVKSSFLIRLNSVFVGCLLIVVPYLITPSKFSCCHVLGFEFAITQDQSLLHVFTDVIVPSDFSTASFDLKHKKMKQKGKEPLQKTLLYRSVTIKRRNFLIKAIEIWKDP